jgi:hypothetical protein
MKSFYEILPKNHFDNLYQKSINVLSKGENVLISAMYGCGSNIFPNYFSKIVRDEKVFDTIALYDPNLVDLDLPRFVSKLKNTKGRTLVMVKSFEKTINKKETLEKIHSLRHLNTFNLVFIFFTDQTGVTNSHHMNTLPYLHHFSMEDFTLVHSARKKHIRL